MNYTSSDVYEFISRQTNDPITERKTCAVSGTKFPIFQSDLDFYKKVSPILKGYVMHLPTPTLCPEERTRRRMAFRHEVNLYSRTCDATDRKIISAYSPDKPYKVYDFDVYWSDKRDPLEYGIDYISGRSFFDQFRVLQLATPRLSLLVDKRNVNSRYVNQANMVKDCYLVRGGVESEGCLYGYRTLQCNHTCDTSFVSTCEYCYQCVDCDACYNCNYCHQSDTCQNAWFLANCRSCEYCFMCTNITNQKYCIENVQYTKEEYFDKLALLDFETHTGIQKLFQQFLQRKNITFHRATNLIDTADCSGNMLRRSKDCHVCYASWDITRCSYSHMISHMEDCKDLSYGWSAQLVYEGATVGDRAYKSCFCIDSWNIQDCYYCDTCINSNHCFGCIGLNGKSYCILNKQYTKDEYESLVEQIIHDMNKIHEWGEFFPMDTSSLAYNETAAGMYFPLTREEVESQKLVWKELNHTLDVPQDMQGISSQDLPETIDLVDEGFLQHAIIGEVSQRPFRIVHKELELYQKKGLPLPHYHPNVRNEKRISYKEPWELYIRTCAKTGNKILSAYSQDIPFKVYSEKAYQEEIYG